MEGLFNNVFFDERMPDAARPIKQNLFFTKQVRFFSRVQSGCLGDGREQYKQLITFTLDKQI